VVERWLSRGGACAVRRERQTAATALACRIAQMLAEDAAPLGAHFSTADAGTAMRTARPLTLGRAQTGSSALQGPALAL